jgi:Protein of unknown function (DUF917)
MGRAYDERVLITHDMLRHQARGCGILGAGGGGSPDIALMAALHATDVYGEHQLVELSELNDDDLVLPMGMVGAPTVAVEKISNGREASLIVDQVERLTGRRVAALMSSEIGGGNGLFPAGFAAALGLPVVDADGMGRAVPYETMIMRTVSVTWAPPVVEPAITTIGSPDWAIPALFTSASATSHSSSMSCDGDTTTRSIPHELRSCREVDALGVIATMGIGGRKRDIARAVIPDRVHATMATAFSSMAARHAAPVMAAVIRVD